MRVLLVCMCMCVLYVYVCVSAYNAYAENLSHESRRSGKGDPSGCEILWQRKYYTTTTRVGIYCAFFPWNAPPLLPFNVLSPCHPFTADLYRPLCAHRDAMKPKCSTQLELLSLLQRSLQRGENLNWQLPRRKWAGNVQRGWGWCSKVLRCLLQFSFASSGAAITAACTQLHITL